MRALLLILLALPAGAATFTFDEAYARALKAHGLDTAFVAGIARLRQEPARWGLPTLRVETSAQRGENADLRNDGIVRLGATTAIVAVDVPVRDRGARARREAGVAVDALLFRRRALDEADQLFTQTLDAFAQLYLADRQLDLLRGVANRPSEPDGMSTAAAREEQALALESEIVDTDLQHLEAESRLRQLMGLGGGERIEAGGDLNVATGYTATNDRPAEAGRSTLQERKERIELDELRAEHRPRLMMTGFGGVTGHSGIYGVRFSLTLPSYDATRVAEAELELEEAERAKNAAAETLQSRADQLQMALEGADRRIELLVRAVSLARARKLSDLEVVHRESNLLAVRVERWKLAQTAYHLSMQLHGSSVASLEQP